MNERFKNKVVLITGAGGGIGQAIALRFAQEGAKVAVNDIKTEGTKETLQLIEKVGGQGLAIPADVSNKSAVETMFNSIESSLGYVDILHNNASLIHEARHFLEGDEDWWDRVQRVNLKSVFLCSLRAAKIMARRHKGVILTTSSGAATRAHRGNVAYDASKGGIEAMTRAMALDLAPYGIRVNGVVPGFINTYGLEGETLREREKVVPLGRYGTAEDLVGAATFLASDEAKYITGQLIVVDGGVLVQQRSANVDTFPLSNFPHIKVDLD